jgi:hypothetical protein
MLHPETKLQVIQEVRQMMKKQIIIEIHSIYGRSE